ncbi:hypothetical protein ACROYT_G013219 [Oculina patagonica]
MSRPNSDVPNAVIEDGFDPIHRNNLPPMKPLQSYFPRGVPSPTRDVLPEESLRSFFYQGSGYPNNSLCTSGDPESDSEADDSYAGVFFLILRLVSYLIILSYLVGEFLMELMLSDGSLLTSYWIVLSFLIVSSVLNSCSLTAAYRPHTGLLCLIWLLEISLDKPSEVCKLVTEGGQLTTTRQKAINLADRSKDEWSALHVYESDELACQKMQRELTVGRKEEGGFGR